MIEQDRLEVAVPDWFQGVFAGKYNDVQTFIEGTIDFVRSSGSA
jgi:hypothetical protein